MRITNNGINENFKIGSQDISAIQGKEKFKKSGSTLINNMKLINKIQLVGMLSLLLVIGCKKDENVDPTTQAPKVISTSPANNAASIAVTDVITASFSEKMDSSTITASTFTLMQGTSSVSGAVTYTGTKATFTPESSLEQNKTFTGTITTGAKDMTGIAMVSNHTFSFTTAADNILPMVSLTDPLSNALTIERNKVIAITFSEKMDSSTITASTFTLKQGTTAVAGTISFSGKKVMFTPTNILGAGTMYTAKITTGVKDLAGNALATNTEWSFTTGGNTAGEAVINLGTAINYVILAKSAIKNNPTSAITGHLGLSPAATTYATGLSLVDATGYATASQVTGKVYAADMADPTPITLTTAVNNMITAYNDAAGRPSPDFVELGTGNVGGKTLLPGLYKWTTTVTVPTNMTISGGANDVWIFQVAGNLSVSSAVKVTLIGGAQAKNIFWQVAGTVTIGTTAHFEGIILSKTGITLNTGASFTGRALAQTAVILDANVVKQP